MSTGGPAAGMTREEYKAFRAAKVAEATRLRKEEGLRAEEIAEKLGVTSRTVLRWLPEDAKMPVHRLTDEERRQMHEMHADGCPNVEIARTFGIHHKSVQKIVGKSPSKDSLHWVYRILNQPIVITEHLGKAA